MEAKDPARRCDVCGAEVTASETGFSLDGKRVLCRTCWKAFLEWLTEAAAATATSASELRRAHAWGGVIYTAVVIAGLLAGALVGYRWLATVPQLEDVGMVLGVCAGAFLGLIVGGGLLLLGRATWWKRLGKAGALPLANAGATLDRWILAQSSSGG